VLTLVTMVMQGVMRLGGVCKVLVIHVNETRNMERVCHTCHLGSRPRIVVIFKALCWRGACTQL
jgi:hypothetical protein